MKNTKVEEISTVVKWDEKEHKMLFLTQLLNFVLIAS